MSNYLNILTQINEIYSRQLLTTERETASMYLKMWKLISLVEP